MGPKNPQFSRESEMRLALEVQQRPILWDATSSLYKRADLKPLAWEEIASAMGSPFTPDMLMKTFKNMKETYAKNLARVRSSKRSGSGQDDIFRPNWYLYQTMSFWEKACAQAESTDNLPQTSTATARTPDVSSNNSQVMSYSATLNAYYDKSTDKWVLLQPDSNNPSPAADNYNMDGLEDDFSEPQIDDVTSDCVPEEHTRTPIISTEEIPRPSSAPVMADHRKSPGEKQDPRKDIFFNKRGSSKASTAAVLENAVKAFEKIASTPPPALSIQETPADAFCSMLNARLSRMTEEARHKCENEIMKVLLNY